MSNYDIVEITIRNRAPRIAENIRANNALMAQWEAHWKAHPPRKRTALQVLQARVDGAWRIARSARGSLCGGLG